MHLYISEQIEISYASEIRYRMPCEVTSFLETYSRVCLKDSTSSAGPQPDTEVEHSFLSTANAWHQKDVRVRFEIYRISIGKITYATIIFKRL
jgi:hypothetical protein